MSCVTRTSLGSTLSPEMDGGTVTTKKRFSQTSNELRQTAVKP